MSIKNCNNLLSFSFLKMYENLILVSVVNWQNMLQSDRFLAAGHGFLYLVWAVNIFIEYIILSTFLLQSSNLDIFEVLLL